MARSLTGRQRRGRLPRATSSLTAVCFAAGLLVAGCASGGSSSTTTSPGGGATTAATMQWSPAGTFGTEPTVVVPSGKPPTQLLGRDLIVGTGTTAQDGDVVTVQYAGYSWTTKEKFDASWDRNQPFTFNLGAGQVIPGWDEGVVGMKVGGRRELVIPPALAYGAASPTPAIAPDDTLIFVIDLLSVSSSTTTTS